MNMKVLLIILVIICSYAVRGQEASSADLLAEKIANRMRDSLDLSGSVRDSIVTINKQINSAKKEKMVAGGVYDDIRKQIQQIENRRDSLYQVILSADKFLLYKQKKSMLIRND